MMRMGDGDGERVGGILAVWRGKRQQHAEHGADLRLVGVPGPDDGFFHRIGRIFRHGQPGLRRDQQSNPARLPEFERRARILVDEGLLDSRLGG